METNKPFTLWTPGSLNASKWSPPGGWDIRWSVEDRYAASVARESALRQGYSEEDAGTLALMSVNMRVLKGMQYSDIWMRKLRAAGLL
jgi:hypothetical protein